MEDSRIQEEPVSKSDDLPIKNRACSAWNWSARTKKSNTGCRFTSNDGGKHVCYLRISCFAKWCFNCARYKFPKIGYLERFRSKSDMIRLTGIESVWRELIIQERIKKIGSEILRRKLLKRLKIAIIISQLPARNWGHSAPINKIEDIVKSASRLFEPARSQKGFHYRLNTHDFCQMLLQRIDSNLRDYEITNQIESRNFFQAIKEMINNGNFEAYCDVIDIDFLIDRHGTIIEDLQEIAKQDPGWGDWVDNQEIVMLVNREKTEQDGLLYDKQIEVAVYGGLALNETINEQLSVELRNVRDALKKGQDRAAVILIYLDGGGVSINQSSREREAMQDAFSKSATQLHWISLVVISSAGKRYYFITDSLNLPRIQDPTVERVIALLEDREISDPVTPQNDRKDGSMYQYRIDGYTPSVRNQKPMLTTEDEISTDLIRQLEALIAANKMLSSGAQEDDGKKFQAKTHFNELDAKDIEYYKTLYPDELKEIIDIYGELFPPANLSGFNPKQAKVRDSSLRVQRGNSNNDNYKLALAALQRVVVLVGPPGIGKSRLVQVAAEELNMPYKILSAASLCDKYKNSGITNANELILPLLEGQEPIIVCLEELTGLTTRFNPDNTATNPDPGVMEHFLLSWISLMHTNMYLYL